MNSKTINRKAASPITSDKSWVRMNRLSDFKMSRIQYFSKCRFRNHIRYVRTNHVDTKNIIIICIDNDFCKPICFTVNKRFSNRFKRKCTNFHFESSLSSLQLPSNRRLPFPDDCKYILQRYHN